MSFTSTSNEVVQRTHYIESELRRAIKFLFSGNYPEASASFEKVSHSCSSNSHDCSLLAMTKPTSDTVASKAVSNPITPTLRDNVSGETNAAYRKEMEK